MSSTKKKCVGKSADSLFGGLMFCGSKPFFWTILNISIRYFRDIPWFFWTNSNIFWDIPEPLKIWNPLAIEHSSGRSQRTMATTATMATMATSSMDSMADRSLESIWAPRTVSWLPWRRQCLRCCPTRRRPFFWIFGEKKWWVWWVKKVEHQGKPHDGKMGSENPWKNPSEFGIFGGPRHVWKWIFGGPRHVWKWRSPPNFVGRSS